MLKNVGGVDRALRVLAGLALVAYALGLVFPGVGYPAIGWLGVVLIATAIVGTCPIYLALGLSSCPVKAKGA